MAVRVPGGDETGTYAEWVESDEERPVIYEVHRLDGAGCLGIAQANGQSCHIISDPEYDNQPDVSRLREYCAGNIVLFCDPLKRPPGPPPDEVLFWIKPLSTKNTSKRCGRFVEEICVWRGKGAAFNSIHWSNMTGVFEDRLLDAPHHPWQKPLSLMEKLVLIYSNKLDLVLDPYCGSGTTLVAAKAHSRSCVGYETNELYYNLARARLNDGLYMSRQ